VGRHQVVDADAQAGLVHADHAYAACRGVDDEVRCVGGTPAQQHQVVGGALVHVPCLGQDGRAALHQVGGHQEGRAVVDRHQDTVCRTLRADGRDRVDEVGETAGYHQLLRADASTGGDAAQFLDEAG